MLVLSQLVYCKVALGINPNRYFKRFSSSIVQSLFLRNIHVKKKTNSSNANHTTDDV